MSRSRTEAPRCARCRLPEVVCICAEIPALSTQTDLRIWMHFREAHKTTATAPLVHAAVTSSTLYHYGARDAPGPEIMALDASRHALLLYPDEDAEVLSAELIARDPRPITLVVPDGTWRQATRAARRLSSAFPLTRVTLPRGEPSAWGLRREPKAFGLATIEACARALGIVESKEIESQLLSVLEAGIRAIGKWRYASQVGEARVQMEA